MVGFGGDGSFDFADSDAATQEHAVTARRIADQIQRGSGENAAHVDPAHAHSIFVENFDDLAVNEIHTATAPSR
jgi:hypothetical protein